jgi:hypothetical protein
MSLRSLPGQLELGFFVLLFRAAALTMSIRELVRFATALSEWLPPTVVEASRRPSLEEAEPAARRASRLVPGARCLHRALAARVWLARRGVCSSLVVGFRENGGLEGHAWLEVGGVRGGEELFVEEGYRESFREADLVEDADEIRGRAPREEESEQLGGP